VCLTVSSVYCQNHTNTIIGTEFSCGIRIVTTEERLATAMTPRSALLSSRVQEAGFHSVLMPHLHPARPPHLKDRSPSQSQKNWEKK
jgi:hypothetical protein